MLLRGDTPRIKIRGCTEYISYYSGTISAIQTFGEAPTKQSYFISDSALVSFVVDGETSCVRTTHCKYGYSNSFYKLISCSSKREPPSEDLLIPVLPDQKGIPIVTLKVHCKNLYLHQQTWNQIHIYMYIFKMLTNTWFTCWLFFGSRKKNVKKKATTTKRRCVSESRGKKKHMNLTSLIWKALVYHIKLGLSWLLAELSALHTDSKSGQCMNRCCSKSSSHQVSENIHCW